MRASPPDMEPCPAVRQWSKGIANQTVHLGLFGPQAEGSAQASLTPFFIGEFPGCRWIDSSVDFSQRSERKVEELQGVGEGSAFSLEVVGLSLHNKPSPEIIGEPFCSEGEFLGPQAGNPPQTGLGSPIQIALYGSL